MTFPYEVIKQYKQWILFVTSLLEAFNLYHADFWVIGPATAGHGRGGCSYVELVATSAQMQRPLWRLSLKWKWPMTCFDGEEGGHFAEKHRQTIL